jgi:uncharacterized protein YggT (Ycf19 family)
MFKDSQTGLIFHHGYIVRSAFVVRLIQIANLLFGVLYVLLGIRFLLEYLEARPVRFVDAIDQWTDPFYRPFRGIVASGQDGAGHPIVWSLLVAFLAYAVLHAAIAGLLRMVNRPPTTD